MVFKGMGQIMLQDNALTGMLFLAGIMYGSVLMGLAAFLATLTGTATAYLLRFDADRTGKGLYGFSPALTGVAMLLFFKPVPAVWMLVIAGASLAAILQHFFMKRNIQVFTLPFVVVTWVILIVVNNFFPFLLLPSSVPPAGALEAYSFALMGFAQVIFQSVILSGILFFLAVFISSPPAALYGLIAAMLSGIAAYYLGVAPADISFGLFGFNAVLCAITFAGTDKKDLLWVLLSVFMALGLSILLTRNNIPQLTFPFVAASVLTLYLKNRFAPHITT